MKTEMPLLSVVVAGSRQEGPPRELMETLRPDLQSGRVELILATARRSENPAPETGVVFLRSPAGTTVPELRAAGVAHARAELVALTEDFCVPGEGWVDALLQAHAGQAVTAAGGPVSRRNGSAAHWALTFCEYGRFLASTHSGRVDDLPGINVCYRTRDVRDALGALPSRWREVDVHGSLHKAGRVLWYTRSALMFDRNSRPLSSALGALYHHGRLFGGQQKERLALLARLARVLMTPVIPPLMWARQFRPAVAAGLLGPWLKAAPLTLVLLTGWALGEAWGYMCGPGDSEQRWL